MAPLGIGGELIGQIVADNAISRRPITQDAIDYQDAVSALSVAAIARREGIQFLSMNASPILDSSLGAAKSRLEVIKRLLVFLTCRESLLRF